MQSLQSTESLKVLVVEDEGLIALDISTRLEALGTRSHRRSGNRRGSFRKGKPGRYRPDGHSNRWPHRRNPSGGGDSGTLSRPSSLSHRSGRPGHPVARKSRRTVRLSSQASRARRAANRPGGRRVQARDGPAARRSRSLAQHHTELGRRCRGGYWADGRVRMLNRAAEVLTGWIQPEAAGRHISNIVQFLDKDSDQQVEDPVPLALVRDALHTTGITRASGSPPQPFRVAGVRDSSLRVTGHTSRCTKARPSEGRRATSRTTPKAEFG